MVPSIKTQDHLYTVSLCSPPRMTNVLSLLGLRYSVSFVLKTLNFIFASLSAPFSCRQQRSCLLNGGFSFGITYLGKIILLLCATRHYLCLLYSTPPSSKSPPLPSPPSPPPSIYLFSLFLYCDLPMVCFKQNPC